MKAKSGAGIGWRKKSKKVAGKTVAYWEPVSKPAGKRKRSSAKKSTRTRTSTRNSSRKGRGKR